MKKILYVLLAGMLFCTPAMADLFGDRSRTSEQKFMLKADGSEEAVSEDMVSASFVDPQSIADYIAALAGKLGVKEGTFFDFENEEFRNYLATTVYTMPEGVAFNVGMVGTDGVLGSVDYNLGAAISPEDVPLLSLFEYLYIGYGIGYLDLDGDDTSLEETDDWVFVHGPTIVFKATF